MLRFRLQWHKTLLSEIVIYAVVLYSCDADVVGLIAACHTGSLHKVSSLT